MPADGTPPSSSCAGQAAHAMPSTAPEGIPEEITAVSHSLQASSLGRKDGPTDKQQVEHSSNVFVLGKLSQRLCLARRLSTWSSSNKLLSSSGPGQ